MSRTEAEGPPNHAITVWAVLGFSGLLGQALWKLTPMALVPIRDGMTSFQLAAAIPHTS